MSDAKNKTSVFPYLMFAGRCEEAIAFYEQAIGAKLEYKMHFNEMPEPAPPGQLAPGFEKKVMHAQFNVAGLAPLIEPAAYPARSCTTLRAPSARSLPRCATP